MTKLETKTHSKLSPSSMARIVSCPGSVALSADIEDETSEYAAEGTVAHEVAERAVVTKGKRFRAMLGKTIEVELNKTDSIKLKVDQEMVDGAEVYWEAIKDSIKGMESVAEILVEQHLDMDWVHPGFGGTADCVVAVPFEKLIVADYKYGVGVVVEPEGNKQAISYALGVLGPDNNYGVQEVEIMIVQPRAFHKDGPVRSWTIPVEDLYRIAKEEFVPAFQLAEAKELTLNVTLDCKWCPAKVNCPAIRKEAMEAASVEMDEKFLPVQGATLPSVADLLPEEIGRVMAMHKPFTDWINAVKTEGLRVLREGKNIPGMKLVKSKTTRNWGNEDLMIAKLGGMCKAYQEPKLKTPAQIEKALKEAGFKKKEYEELVKPFVESTMSTTFAPNSDKRLEISLVEDAKDAFAELGDDGIFS